MKHCPHLTAHHKHQAQEYRIYLSCYIPREPVLQIPHVINCCLQNRCNIILRAASMWQEGPQLFIAILNPFPSEHCSRRNHCLIMSCSEDLNIYCMCALKYKLGITVELQVYFSEHIKAIHARITVSIFTVSIFLSWIEAKKEYSSSQNDRSQVFSH